MAPYNLLAILGPTASGKTSLAAQLAARLNGEVISADSRQVYRGMDIGTGKDMADYIVNGHPVPVHLVDIVDAGYQYNVYEYQRDFLQVWNDLQRRGKFPVLCGGSGLYLEAVLDNYRLIQVPVDEDLRASLEGKSLEELTQILSELKPQMHNVTDVDTERRAVRAIEIERYYLAHPEKDAPMPELRSLVIGIKYDRLSRRKRISQRLHQRLNEGMVEEVKKLLLSGLSVDDLVYYGLEYKYITYYLEGELLYDEMTEKLNTAIHQFAKRQMTWFRRMERQGTEIHWLDGYMPTEEKIERVMALLAKNS